MLKKISVPKDRMAALIGIAGTTKRDIENKTGTKLHVNDEVTIEGDGIGLLDAENIIKAVSRGFPPEKAMHLLDEEKTLCIIQLPKSRKTLSRIKARIIGKKGKSRENIERLTGSDIAVYGRTVSIIGTYGNVHYSAEAVERLIRGYRHASVYRYLEDLNARGKIGQKDS